MMMILIHIIITNFRIESTQYDQQKLNYNKHIMHKNTEITAQC